MSCKKRFWLCLILSLFVLSGCYNKPVRHLASDVSLIKAEKSSREDVLLLLGEPDAQQMVSAEMEEWVYYEEDPSLMQQSPLIGGMFSPNGYGKIVLTLKGDLVVTCRYSSYNKDDNKWADDYSWQEKK